MAAGAIPIAHASGGPQTDIVKPEPVDGEMQETGYLCDSVEQYSRALTEVLRMDTHARLAMSGAARRRSSRFSDERFQHDFLEAVMPLLTADGILPTNKSKHI
jgi:alpha-1,2-mannosyltransferase